MENSSPLPLSPGVDPHAEADIAFHAEHAPLYDAQVASEYAIYDSLALLPFLDRFREHGADLRVLDLGCGTGAVTLHLASRGFTVNAVDHSPDMVAVAQAKIERANAAGSVSFDVTSAGYLPFGNERFDLVTCQRVLHHIPDVEPVFGEVKRVLKPGGAFYLSDGAADWTPAARALRGVWKAMLPRLREPEVLDHPPPGHEVLRRADEFRRQLDVAGFSYDMRFYTHVGAQRYLSERQRLLLIRLLSAPWRKRKGDLFFAYATSVGA